MSYAKGLSKRELEELEAEYAALNEETKSLKSQGFTLEDLEKELEAQEPTKIADSLRGLSETMRRQQENINAIDKTLERMIEQVKNNPDDEFVMVNVTPDEKAEAQRYLDSAEGRRMQEKIKRELPKRRKFMGLFGGANGEKGASVSTSSESNDKEYKELIEIAKLYGSLAEKELLERQKNLISQIITKQLKLKDEYNNPKTTKAQKTMIGKQVLDLKSKKNLLKKQHEALLKNIKSNSKIAALTIVSTYQNISPEAIRRIPQAPTKEMPAKVKSALGIKKGGKRRKTMRKHSKKQTKRTQKKHTRRTQKKQSKRTQKKHTRRTK